MQYTSQNARFSCCRRYRYSLERSWSGGRGRVLFIGLNPSTADQHRDDATIRRCVGFAKSWGFSSMEIVNLFAYRATYPKDLKRAADPVGRRNPFWISKAYRAADQTIACWGNEGNFLSRADELRQQLTDLYCLKINQNRQPAHPLYLKADLLPRPLPAVEHTVRRSRNESGP